MSLQLTCGDLILVEHQLEERWSHDVGQYLDFIGCHIYFLDVFKFIG
jgi:hypothetical protein